MPTSKTDSNKSKVRSRYKRDAAYGLPLQVIKRDLKILEVVGDYRLLTAYQISKLFFNSLHKARKRLFRLWQHGFLDRRFQPVRLGEGASQILYTLSRKGAQLLFTRGGVSGETQKSAPFAGRGSALFVEHTLKRNDFRIALTLACSATADVKLLFWRQDSSIKDVVTFLNGRDRHAVRRVPIMADGFFSIEHGNRKKSFFVEIDRGTVGNKRMLARMKGYYHLWLQQRHVQKYGIKSFRVLVTTMSVARMDNLIKTARQVREGNGGSGLFWFTTFNQYDLERPQSILAPIWKRSVTENGNRYSLLGRPA